MSENELEVRLEIRIGASPKMVFTLLTDPTHMRIWLAEFVEADARPGGVFRISGPVGVCISTNYIAMRTAGNQRAIVPVWRITPGLAIVTTT